MAPKYRPIYTHLFDDEKVRKFEPLNVLVMIYLITAQSNRIGIFVFSPGRAAEDLKLPVEETKERIRHVVDTLAWAWDEVARVVWIPTWWKFNRSMNTNQMAGNIKDLGELPSTPLIERFADTLHHFESKSVLKAFANGVFNVLGRFPEGFIPETEPEQEQDKEPKTKGTLGEPGTLRLPDASGSGDSRKRHVAGLIRGKEFLIGRHDIKATLKIFEHLESHVDVTPAWLWASLVQCRGKEKPAAYLVKLIGNPDFSPSDVAIETAKNEMAIAAEDPGFPEFRSKLRCLIQKMRTT